MSNDKKNHDFEASPNPDIEWLGPVQASPFTEPNVSDLATLAVARFPEIPGAALAKAMRMAADQVEKGEVESPSCAHSWEQQGEQYCITSWMERCPKCDALRQREVRRSLDNSPPT